MIQLPIATKRILNKDGFSIFHDVRSRPHYIVTNDKRIKGAILRSKSLVTRFCLLIEDSWKKFKSESPILSIHLGFYRTDSTFHAHLVSRDCKQYSTGWKSLNSRLFSKDLVNQMVEGIEQYDEHARKQTLKYRDKDVKCLNRKVAARKTVLKEKVTFSNDTPVLSIKQTSKDFRSLYFQLVSVVDQLNLVSPNRGGHLCIEKEGQNQYRGYLLVDVPTYYRICPNRDAWLEKFSQNDGYCILT